MCTYYIILSRVFRMELYWILFILLKLMRRTTVWWHTYGFKYPPSHSLTNLCVLGYQVIPQVSGAIDGKRFVCRYLIWTETFYWLCLLAASAKNSFLSSSTCTTALKNTKTIHTKSNLNILKKIKNLEMIDMKASNISINLYNGFRETHLTDGLWTEERKSFSIPFI